MKGTQLSAGRPASAWTGQPEGRSRHPERGIREPETKGLLAREARIRSNRYRSAATTLTLYEGRFHCPRSQGAPAPPSLLVFNLRHLSLRSSRSLSAPGGAFQLLELVLELLVLRGHAAISPAALASASIWSTFAAMRSKVSNEEVADRDPIVCAICFCASALLARR